MASTGTPASDASGDDLATQLARRAAAIMWNEDRASQALGMTLTDVGPGRATMRMAIRADMTNGHGICHGGYMFLLADSTLLAYACNSHDQRAVAAGAEIHFAASAHEGDILTAQGREAHRAGRSGIYDIEVRDQEGRPRRFSAGVRRRSRALTQPRAAD
ncbi:MAG: hydroxyphenylacetyl-CoA thioesterase PaaI [Burkholderiaceae bacterium]